MAQPFGCVMRTMKANAEELDVQWVSAMFAGRVVNTILLASVKAAAVRDSRTLAKAGPPSTDELDITHMPDGRASGGKAVGPRDNPAAHVAWSGARLWNACEFDELDDLTKEAAQLRYDWDPIRTRCALNG